MNRILSFAAMAGLLVLSACGTASDSAFLRIANTLKQSTMPGQQPSLEAQRAAVIQTVRNAGQSDPVLMIELPANNAVASTIIGGRNGGAVTWLDATGVSVTTRNGVVIATRGLGYDLMASDMRGTISALSGRTASYGRLHRYLDAEGVLNSVTFSCQPSRNGATLTERCTSGRDSFVNTYQLNGSTVVRSRQWIGPVVGYADLVRLQ
ncbi:hypothetical protein E4Z66_14850 [Aliishimia ponticola]|uniref:YjbF family lipoprotein n=1 Tax=Aliishimia ponticola TaxID=2499833 RepID=A0A4V3XK06_9RHOB|nr:YjbF family lipoprotein [Aliishimia ponticola]THH35103.1 hypothetical protein E4Z66_14850 [Aliishimia ponticola]